VSKIPRGFVL